MEKSYYLLSLNFIWLIWKYLNDSKTPNNIIFQLELQNPNKLHMKYSSTTFEKVILFSLQNCDCGFQYFKKSQTKIKALWFSWINFPNHSFLYWTKCYPTFITWLEKVLNKNSKGFNSRENKIISHNPSHNNETNNTIYLFTDGK